MKLKKYISMLLVTAIMTVSTIANTFANEQQLPQISTWAMGTLNEGEKYGIFPITWYYDGFQNPITEEKLNYIAENISNKISSLGFEEDNNYLPKANTETITRQHVITVLYNAISQYILPESLEVANYNPVEYFQKRNILKGTNNGLELDKPCTVEQTAVLATKLVEDICNEASAGSQGFLWKATNENNTMYLLGSIHIGTTDLYPFNKRLKDAFYESDALIVEANISNLSNPEMLQEFLTIAMYTDGTTLKDHVSEELYNKTIETLEMFNLPTEQYVYFKPWSIANDLLVMASSSNNSTDEVSAENAATAASLGIDMYYMTTSFLINKPIIELEGLKYQAELFNNLSKEYQEYYLNNSLDNILNIGSEDDDDSVNPIALWQQQWNEGKVEDFRQSFQLADEGDELSQMLLGERDRNMADKLSFLLDQEGEATYFVVIGAAHLISNDAVVDLLISKGYNVEIVQ